MAMNFSNVKSFSIPQLKSLMTEYTALDYIRIGTLSSPLDLGEKMTSNTGIYLKSTVNSSHADLSTGSGTGGMWYTLSCSSFNLFLKSGNDGGQFLSAHTQYGSPYRFDGSYDDYDGYYGVQSCEYWFNYRSYGDHTFYRKKEHSSRSKICTYTNTDSTDTLKLLSYTQAGFYNYYVNIYSIKIKQSSSVEIVYYPAKRISDDVVGLLKIKNNTFEGFLTPDIGSALAGPTNSNVIRATYPVVKLQDSNSNILWANEDLYPYRRLEYVTCDGSAGIKTDIWSSTSPSQLNIFYTKFMPTNIGTQQRIIANYNGNASLKRKYPVILTQDGKIQNTIGSNWGGTANAQNNTAYVVESSMVYNDRYITVNGTKETLTNSSNEGGSNNTEYGYGCGWDTASSSFGNGFIGRLYGLKATSKSYANQTHYIIPAQRKSDGKVGFVYIKTDGSGNTSFYQFMPSAWTNEFGAGPVTNEYFDHTVAPSMGF